MVSKVEWHQGELFPRVGFIVTNLSYLNIGIVRFAGAISRKGGLIWGIPAKTPTKLKEQYQ